MASARPETGRFGRPPFWQGERRDQSSHPAKRAICFWGAIPNWKIPFQIEEKDQQFLPCFVIDFPIFLPYY
jgi:hypothetical protein